MALSCTPADLIESAKCFTCLSEKEQQAILTYLACQLANSGTSGPQLFTGSGSPEGAVTADPGSIYTQIVGGVVVAQWVKVTGSGNTGWQ